MASNVVGVDPEWIAQAASALEQLRDALAANVLIIVSTLEEYWSSDAGSPVSLAPLKQAQARSVQDAADMRARSNLAATFMAEAVNIDLVIGTCSPSWPARPSRSASPGPRRTCSSPSR